MSRYIFLTGGVVSALGKGVATASIGLLLKRRGFAVNILKMDPYLNVDPGTMNPFQHGEVFVTDDGAETDLDLGHYERFIDQSLGQVNNVTSGKIYNTVIEKERRGDYLGGTVQVVPHLTNEIKDSIKRLGEDEEIDIVLTEVGGTVGDIEGLPFLEAIRQMRLEEGPENVLFIHLTLVPYVETAGELKTKPTQHSVQKLREIGIQPDMLVCRVSRPLTEEAGRKIALFSNLPEADVFESVDVETVYEVPLVFQKQGVDNRILKKLRFKAPKANLKDWEAFVREEKNPEGTVTVSLCGKYINLKDSYKSIIEAFHHAGVSNGVKVELRFVDSEEVEEKGPEALLSDVDGLLVPGGFGQRGIEGKIEAVRYARENGLPYFGICLGLQIATVEFARNVQGWADANSSEFDPKTSHPVIDILPTKKGVKEMGGTLRLGAYPCKLEPDTLARSVYGQDKISERHRHRYEINPKYEKRLSQKGLRVSGRYEEAGLAEIVENPDHPFFIAVQFHPEFKSRPMKPHPLFHAFIRAAKEFKARKGERGEEPGEPKKEPPSRKPKRSGTELFSPAKGKKRPKPKTRVRPMSRARAASPVQAMPVLF
jgi:CTP synthase